MADDKTEQPTPRRLRKAREQGDVPVSSALTQALGFLAALAVLPGAALATASTAGALIRAALEGRTLSPWDMAGSVLVLSLPVIGVAAIVALFVAAIQAGGLIAPGRVLPDLSRLNPISGLAGLFRWQRLFGVVRALVSAALVAYFAVLVLRALLPSLVNTPGELGAALALTADGTRRLLWYAGLVGLVLGAVDLLFVRRAWLARWKMTRDEVRREYRESEGDPETKAARRRAHQEMLASASLAAVRKASVVIVNPTHLAVALRYEEDEDPAPRVVAQGQGDLARRIVAEAHHYGVPVVRDVPVARALSELEIGDEIPEALYEAVAEILRELWDAERGAAPTL